MRSASNQALKGQRSCLRIRTLAGPLVQGPTDQPEPYASSRKWRPAIFRTFGPSHSRALGKLVHEGCSVSDALRTVEEAEAQVLANPAV